MYPNEGYMLNTSQAGLLIYPDNVVTSNDEDMLLYMFQTWMKNHYYQ